MLQKKTKYSKILNIKKEKNKKEIKTNSICSYFTPYCFNELLLGFSPNPITVCSVSYGAPVMLIIVSFGLNSADRVIASACVPDMNCALTKQQRCKINRNTKIKRIFNKKKHKYRQNRKNNKENKRSK